MKMTVWRLVFVLFLFTLGAFYTLLAMYNDNQRHDIKSIVLKSIRSDMSEITYMLSKNITDKKDVKNYRALLERYISNNDFLDYAMILDDDNVLITTDLSHKTAPANEMLHKKIFHYTHHTLIEKKGVEGVIRYFEGSEVKFLRLVLAFDLEEINFYLNKHSRDFWIYFGVWIFVISAVIILVVQFLIIKPLNLLHRYTFDRSSIPNMFIIKDIESIRFSMVQDYEQIEEKQTELAKFKIAIEQSPISIIITDIKGNIEYVNPYFTVITGYTLHEVSGKNPSLLASGYTDKKEYEALWADVCKSKIWRGTFKNVRKNGEKYWESAIIAPVKNTEGEIINYIGIKQDISEKIKMQSLINEQEELMISQSRQAAMGEMIGMIAHQWRQPLSIISMGANNLLLNIELDDIDVSVFKDEMTSILEQVQHLSTTIEDFRNYFHPNKEKENVTIDDVVSETLGIINKSLENHNISVECALSSPSLVLIYKRELVQVLINIINNAKEALIEESRDNMCIVIQTSETDKEVIIEICDNAAGIKKEIMQKIFEPYFSTKDEKTGTGLGLYISKTIIEKHLKGILEVKNNAPRGTCFRILIDKESTQ